MRLPPMQESVADIPEGKLVGQLLGEAHWRDLILNLKGLPANPRIMQQGPLANAPGAPKGDIDILLSPPGWPAEATAIEVKRIRFGEAAFEPAGQPNKLQEYRKGVAQANRLHALGFFQVYLYVLVVVDSRARNYDRIAFDGLTSEQRSLIEATVSLEHLQPGVGLAECTFVQPMDHPPLTVGTSGLHLRRAATPREQLRGLTDWLVSVMG